MNRNIKLSILFTISIILLACSFSIPIDEVVRKEYSEIKGMYPQELVSHLPNLDDGNVIYYEFLYPKGNYLSCIHLMVKYSDKQIDSIKSTIDKSAKRYCFKDSCLMIVEYDPIIYESSPIILKKCINSPNLLPVPNFKFCIEAGMTSEFYKNATIYVLGAKKGKFCEDDALSIIGVGLSEEWTHGYTKGIMISGNIVAYWLEVW